MSRVKRSGAGRLSRRDALAGAAATTVLSLAPASQAAETPPLKDLATARGILYGSAIAAVQISNDHGFTDLVLRECAAIVPEAEMKWGEMTTPEGKEDYTAPDAVADFALQHHLALRGHALIWYQNLPDWFTALTDRAAMEKAILRRIDDMCRRYRGRVFCWDVVNEAINADDGRPDALRKAVFLDRLGPDYIDVAHRAARAADPDALLVVNDYGIEYDTPGQVRKRLGVLHLLERLKKAGTPLDALGIQAHLRTGGVPYSAPKLRQFLAEVAAMGLAIHITELDVDDDRAPGLLVARDQLVADEYTRFLETALAEPAVNVVMTWGMSDRYTWLDGELNAPKRRSLDGQTFRPLPFDRDLRPKPAAAALARAFIQAAIRPSPRLPAQR